jgi:hypothetical protein
MSVMTRVPGFGICPMIVGSWTHSWPNQSKPSSSKSGCSCMTSGQQYWLSVRYTGIQQGFSPRNILNRFSLAVIGLPPGCSGFGGCCIIYGNVPLGCLDGGILLKSTMRCTPSFFNDSSESFQNSSSLSHFASVLLDFFFVFASSIFCC